MQPLPTLNSKQNTQAKISFLLVTRTSYLMASFTLRTRSKVIKDRAVNCPTTNDVIVECSIRIETILWRPNLRYMIEYTSLVISEPISITLSNIIRLSDTFFLFNLIRRHKPIPWMIILVDTSTNHTTMDGFIIAWFGE